MNHVTQRLIDRVTEPSDGDAFSKWIALEDTTSLLRADLGQDDIILYCSHGDIFIHAVLIPSTALTQPDADDLMAWNENPYSSWTKLYSLNPPTVSIEPPLASSFSRTIATGEQLVFARHFEGVSDRVSIELLQKLTQLFDLHYLEERYAYCRLDERGDVEDVVGITLLEYTSDCPTDGIVVTIRRSVIDEYMAITDTTMLRMFDITRRRRRASRGWAPHHEAMPTTDGDLIYRHYMEPDHASYTRGVQIVPSHMSRKSVAEQYRYGDRRERQYESFIAIDWKNDIIREISTEPGHTANYFTKSDLPFELSPAFFRPEVLLRYKSDSDKYTLQNRSISCRGAWHLDTYDINDANQVHTYIVYLRNLPYEEQLYWKAHNEPPKASLSTRAIKADFEGEWDREYDALDSLQNAVRQLNKKAPSWWIQRPEKVVQGVHYPVTTSPDEWADEILALDQLVIEGLRGKTLRSLATSLDRNPIIGLGSLKLVEECLMGLEWSEDRAREVTASLHKLHYYRSKIRAHSQGKEGNQIRKDILREHHSYGGHFKALCAECDDALRTIDIALGGQSTVARV